MVRLLLQLLNDRPLLSLVDLLEIASVVEVHELYNLLELVEQHTRKHDLEENLVPSAPIDDLHLRVIFIPITIQVVASPSTALPPF